MRNILFASALIFSVTQTTAAERFKSETVPENKTMFHCRSYHSIFYSKILIQRNDRALLKKFIADDKSCGFLPANTHFDRRPSGYPDEISMLLLEDGTVTWSFETQ